MTKINGKHFLVIGYWLLVIGLFVLLVYSRFTNLDWGLPYPMHPDERNMANAIQNLNCDPSTLLRTSLKECFNPHFFAYGQFPLYLGYLIVYLLKFFDGDLRFPINFQEAIISLRIISAVASIINVFVLTKIIEFILNIKDQISNPSSKFKDFNFTLSFALCTLIFTFSPYAIQFSHFGTTESLLMLLYSIIIYLSLQLQENHRSGQIVRLALVSGLAIATKVSSILFLAVPIYVFLSKIKDQRSNPISKLKDLGFVFIFAFCTLIFALFFSPHNLLNFNDFLGSMNYESDVALGKSLVFYTRQFFGAKDFLFQFEKVFPYTLGWSVFIMGLIGFIGINWKDKKINLLRFAFLIYFIPSAMIYAKWSRFMSPIFSIITVFAVLFLQNLISKLNHKLWIPTFAGMTILAIIPGIAYLHIYQTDDVRYKASDWIYKNIPNNSYILFETANVVDIPLEVSSYKVHQVYQVISFNFYDLDENQSLQKELKEHLARADYIFIPSRRIFANHTCYTNEKLQITNIKSISNNKCQILKQKYPVLNQYYEDLFSGRSGFEKVAEFESYPKIKFQVSSFKFQVDFPDEQAEETWTVFDHPVIKIYKKVK